MWYNYLIAFKRKCINSENSKKYIYVLVIFQQLLCTNHWFSFANFQLFMHLVWYIGFIRHIRSSFSKMYQNLCILHYQTKKFICHIFCQTYTYTCIYVHYRVIKKIRLVRPIFRSRYCVAFQKCVKLYHKGMYKNEQRNSSNSRCV